MPGWYLQVRNAEVTASSTMPPADSTTCTSVRSPDSRTTKERVTEARWPDLSGGASLGYVADVHEIFFGGASTSPLAYTCGSSTGPAGGVGVVVRAIGLGEGTGTSCASTRAVLPAATATRFDHGSNPVAVRSNWCGPGLSLSNVAGVWPAGAPSTLICAPCGVERTSAMPKAGGSGTRRGFTSARGSAAVIVMGCVKGV